MPAVLSAPMTSGSSEGGEYPRRSGWGSMLGRYAAHMCTFTGTDALRPAVRVHKNGDRRDDSRLRHVEPLDCARVVAQRNESPFLRMSSASRLPIHTRSMTGALHGGSSAQAADARDGRACHCDDSRSRCTRRNERPPGAHAAPSHGWGLSPADRGSGRRREASASHARLGCHAPGRSGSGARDYRRWSRGVYLSARTLGALVG